MMRDSVCIVGGCGHIGLPLGLALAAVGVKVTLLDTDSVRVGHVAAGQMPFLERGAEEFLPRLLATGRLQGHDFARGHSRSRDRHRHDRNTR